MAMINRLAMDAHFHGHDGVKLAKWYEIQNSHLRWMPIFMGMTECSCKIANERFRRENYVHHARLRSPADREKPSAQFLHFFYTKAAQSCPIVLLGSVAAPIEGRTVKPLKGWFGISNLLKNLLIANY